MVDKPKIRHLALFTPNPEKLARFYVNVFEMEIVHRSRGADGKGGVFLTDGYISLAILPQRTTGEMAAGLNHFGFKVDDVEAIAEKLAAEGVEAPTMRPAERPYAEYRAADPYGNLFDLSEHGYDRVEARSEREKASSAGRK
jgi:catechol 2,3-dioxygenase-like lactoylglutathione lyase family enzyme